MARILTTEQAAEKLQVKPLTIRKYLRNGVIPGKKLGRGWLILETDIERVIGGEAKSEPAVRVSALGFLADVPGFGTEEFLKSKREEVEIEEAKFRGHFSNSKSNT